MGEGLLRGGLRLTVEGGLLPHGQQLSDVPQWVDVQGTARSGEEITTATVSEILDMAATAGPSSVEERRRSVRAAGRPLDINPLGHVGELLAVWEQPSFDREPQAAAQEALTHAREVVTRW